MTDKKKTVGVIAHVDTLGFDLASGPEIHITADGVRVIEMHPENVAALRDDTLIDAPREFAIRNCHEFTPPRIRYEKAERRPDLSPRQHNKNYRGKR